MSYIDMIKERARIDKKTIVLPESNDKRTLLAAARIVEEGIADIIMIGDEEKIMDGAGWLEVDLSKVTVVNPKTTPKLDDYVNLLYETRKAKGMTPEKAREILLNDYLTFGIVMVKANDADGMVAGACHSTADTLRPALQILKTAPGVKLVSAFFVMDTVFKDQGENGTFLFADCGLNQDPTPEELAAIADIHAYSISAVTGVLRAGGDVFWSTLLDVGPQWCMALPLTALLALVLKADYWWIAAAIQSESLLKVPLCALRIRTGQWIHDVTVRKERGQ